MKFMLDTNTCIYIINRRPNHVAQTFAQQDVNDICVSSIVLFELSYGASKSRSTSSRTLLERFIEPIAVIDFDAQSADLCGQLRTDLERKGKVIGPYDLQIAAHALTLDATLVTNNMREFKKVKGLKLENWF